MAGQSAEGDSIDLYQVFQSSYNKITKNEYSSSGEGEAYPPPHELYPPDSRFFPFDTRLQGKCEKGEERGAGGWYADSPAYTPDSAIYYPNPSGEQEWGGGYPPHYPPELSPALHYQAEAGFGSSAGGGAASYARPPAQIHQLDDAINILKGHVDLTQVFGIR